LKVVLKRHICDAVIFTGEDDIQEVIDTFPAWDLLFVFIDRLGRYVFESGTGGLFPLETGGMIVRSESNLYTVPAENSDNNKRSIDDYCSVKVDDSLYA